MWSAECDVSVAAMVERLGRWGIGRQRGRLVLGDTESLSMMIIDQRIGLRAERYGLGRLPFWAVASGRFGSAAKLLTEK